MSVKMNRLIVNCHSARHSELCALAAAIMWRNSACAYAALRRINAHQTQFHMVTWPDRAATASTYPSVVMVTMVYQKAAGILVNLLAVEPFSA